MNLQFVQIAESLSQVAVTEIIGVVLAYCVKSLLEKRRDFGEVGSSTSQSENVEEN